MSRLQRNCHGDSALECRVEGCTWGRKTGRRIPYQSHRSLCSHRREAVFWNGPQSRDDENRQSADELRRGSLSSRRVVSRPCPTASSDSLLLSGPSFANISRLMRFGSTGSIRIFSCGRRPAIRSSVPRCVMVKEQCCSCRPCGTGRIRLDGRRRARRLRRIDSRGASSGRSSSLRGGAGRCVGQRAAWHTAPDLGR